MNNINFELTDVQYNNLMTFISRASLTGNEVPAYVEILNILNKVRKDETK